MDAIPSKIKNRVKSGLCAAGAVAGGIPYVCNQLGIESRLNYLSEKLWIKYSLISGAEPSTIELLARNASVVAGVGALILAGATIYYYTISFKPEDEYGPSKYEVDPNTMLDRWPKPENPDEY